MKRITLQQIFFLTLTFLALICHPLITWASSPYLGASIQQDFIFGNQFPPNSQVNVTITPSGASVPKAGFYIQSGSNGSFWAYGYDNWNGVPLAPGDMIQATCNGQSTSMEIQDLHATVDLASKSVTGTALSLQGNFLAGRRVDIYIFPNGGGNSLYADSTPVQPDGTFVFDLAGKFDLLEGQQVHLYLWDDPDGNSLGNQTTYHPYNGSHLYIASLDNNAIQGLDFPINSPLTLSINADPALTTSITTDSGGNFFQNITGFHYLLKAGDIVAISYGTEIYGSAKELSYTIPGLTASVDADNNVISGTAAGFAGQSLQINIFSSGYQLLFQTTVSVDVTGGFSSTLGFDLVPGQIVVFSALNAYAGISVYNGTPVIYVGVMQIHVPDVGFKTRLTVTVWPDSNAVIDSIAVTGPSGPLPYTKDDFLHDPINYPYFYWIDADGSPELGIYTFTVKSGSLTATEQDTQTINREIPIPVLISPELNATLDSKTPIFAWNLVSYPDTTIYYRLVIDDMMGFRVVSPPSNSGMLAYTVPRNLLKPGQTYQFQVRAEDASNSVKHHNEGRSEWRTFTMGNDLQHAAVPAIDLDAWGVATLTKNNGTGVELSVKVIDRDGVASDGSSHQVTVSTPYGVRQMAFDAVSSRYSVYYWAYIDAPAMGVSAIPGDYVFTVTDPDGNTGTLTDTLVVNSLPLINQNSMTPASGAVLTDTSPVFTWDSVSGAQYYRVRIYSDDLSKTIWTGYTGYQSLYPMSPGVLQPYTAYRYRVDARDAHLNLNINNQSKTPATGSTYIRFTTGGQAQSPLILSSYLGAYTVNTDQDSTFRFMVCVNDAQGVPGNIQSVTVTLPDGSVKDLNYVQSDSRNTLFRGFYQSTDMMQIPTSGEYTYVFRATDTDNNTDSLSETMTVDPIGYPERSSLLPPQGTILQDTAVDFDWADVPGAAFYQINIYNANNDLFYTLSTTDSSYHLPPGYLKKGTVYHYQIVTFREFMEQNVNNESYMPADLSSKMMFMTAGWTPMQGDVNGDEVINLEDVMISLQILSGKPVTVISGADINGDDKIGMQEVIYNLQKVAGLI